MFCFCFSCVFFILSISCLRFLQWRKLDALQKTEFIYDIRPLNDTINVVVFILCSIRLLIFFHPFVCSGWWFTFTLLLHFINYFRSLFCFCFLFSLFAVTVGGSMKHRKRVQTLILQSVGFGWSWMIAYVRSAYGMISLFDTMNVVSWCHTTEPNHRVYNNFMLNFVFFAFLYPRAITLA